MTDLFKNHIATLLDQYHQILVQQRQQGLPVEKILIDSGSDSFYFADDQAIPFRAFGHFCRWVPINRPDQLMLVAPGERPIYFQVISPDYWNDQSIENASWWGDEFEIVILSSKDQLADHIRNYEGIAYIGENTAYARELDFDLSMINPLSLLYQLDYFRAYKTPYEVEQIRSANTKALLGHDAAKKCFENGGSEYNIHMSYLQACDILEEECPYTSIVALNEKSAILHYQHKRHIKRQGASEKSQVLLIDAGCRINNYCSDITRTSVRPFTHSVFKSLAQEMEKLELELVNKVSPKLSYIDFHRIAIELLGHVLIAHEIVKCSLDQALKQNLPSLFMPHGIGHLLGIQVHDVGGHLSNAEGGVRPPPLEFPFLRNTRAMEQDMVFTVEPGLYFIPVLLNPEKSTPKGKLLNWDLIEELLPLGGIRVEDNVLVGKTSGINLTRQ